MGTVVMLDTCLKLETHEDLREAAKDEHKPNDDVAQSGEEEQVFDQFVVEGAQCQSLVEEEHGELHAPNK